MVAAVAAAFKADTLARSTGEFAQHLRRDRLVPRVLKHGLGAFGIGLRLIADCLEAVDTILERRVIQAGYTRLDGVVEALEARFGFRRTPVQFANVLTAEFGSLLPPVAQG
jgi:hypothetical protein